MLLNQIKENLVALVTTIYIKDTTLETIISLRHNKSFLLFATVNFQNIFIKDFSPPQPFPSLMKSSSRNTESILSKKNKKPEH